MTIKLDLYVSESGCVPCAWIKKFVANNNINVNIITNKDHPLVHDVPTIIIDDASVIKGVLAIQRYLETHIIPKKVE